MSFELIKEIYNKQLDLNRIIGRDTLNDNNKLNWLFDYCFALDDEVQELKNCIDWKWWSKTVKEDPSRQYKVLLDRENAIIEVIDCIHFVISLCHITDITAEQLTDIYDRTLNTIAEEDKCSKCKCKCSSRFNSLFRCIINLKFTANDLLSLAYYDIHIKDGDQIDFRITSKIEAIWSLLLEIAVKHLNINLEEITNVYRMKWKKNIERQNNDYDVRYKTEEDNQEICQQIK